MRVCLPKSRRGFTLAELLVVVVIIGMLVAMVAGAVISSQRTAQQAACLHKLTELAKAVQHYESRTRHYPGSINRLQGQVVGWPIVLLSDLGRGDVLDALRKGNQAPVTIDELVCPEDSLALSQPAPLSYVANLHLFRDRTMPRPINISSSDLQSAQRTLLFSERLGSGPWNSNAPDRLGVFWPERGVVGDVLKSEHPGGVNVAFCDGHVKFIPDETEVGTILPGPRE